MTVPLCTNCCHADWSEEALTFTGQWRCWHPRAAEINNVTGVVACKKMREAGPCGTSGLLFELKTPKPRYGPWQRLGLA